jgi:hypothetical protein
MALKVGPFEHFASPWPQSLNMTLPVGRWPPASLAVSWTLAPRAALGEASVAQRRSRLRHGHRLAGIGSSRQTSEERK